MLGEADDPAFFSQVRELTLHLLKGLRHVEEDVSEGLVGVEERLRLGLFRNGTVASSASSRSAVEPLRRSTPI